MDKATALSILLALGIVITGGVYYQTEIAGHQVSKIYDELNQTSYVFLDENLLLSLQKIDEHSDLTYKTEKFNLTSYASVNIPSTNGDFTQKIEKHKGKFNITSQGWTIEQNEIYYVTISDYGNVVVSQTIEYESITDITSTWVEADGVDYGVMDSLKKFQIPSANGTSIIGADSYKKLVFKWTEYQQTGTHQEERIKKVMTPFSGGFTIEAGKSYIVELTLTKPAEVGEFSYFIVPKLYGLEFPEFSWWNVSWNSRITNNLPDGARPYLYSLNISNSSGTNNATHIFGNGNFNVNYTDLRFVLNDNTELEFGIENVSADSTVAWVNVTGNGTVSMYYNNPDATGTEHPMSDLNSLGGNVTGYSGYIIQNFTVNDTFLSFGNYTVEVLVVAGGGGGGYSRGGGGGAGGLIHNASYATTLGTKIVTVGNGGAGGTSDTVCGSSGSNSVFNDQTTIGGGGGGGASNWNGINGGSGGGAAFNTVNTKSGIPGTGTGSQGYGGGSAGASPHYGGGGGGGAGSVGANGLSTGTTVAAGGVGVTNTFFGSSITYATGGVGGHNDVRDQNGATATANTGDGGGGAQNYNVANDGGAGGSGIVIIRYNETGIWSTWTSEQYYSDSLLYNATSNYNHTIESDGTITSNRSIDAADDTNWTAYGDDTNWIFTTSVTPAGNTNFTLNGGVLYNFTVANMTASTEYSVNNGSEVGTFTTDGDGIAIFETDLIAGSYTVAQTVAGNTPPVISGEVPSTPYASTTVDEVTFSATIDQSNSNNQWLINGSLLEWDNTTSSPSYTNSSPVAGSYNITLISYNSTDSTKSNQTTWTWGVTNELGNIPGIVNGVFAFETNTIPSNATILDRKNDSIITISISVDWDSIDATVWGNVKNAISYAYSQNMRSSVTLNFSGDYTDSVYWTNVKNNFTNYLPDLTVDPYQADVHYITFGFTNITASNIEKVNFANNVTFNMSANLNHKINIISKENLDGFGNYISVSPIKYVILTSGSDWIDDEVRILRGNTTKSRSYEGNVSFLSDVNSYRVNALNKIRGTSNISGQYSETDTVKIDNGDVILYNNASSISNVTIASADSGYYFDIINDVYLNLSSGGTLHFNVSAYSFTYVIKDTFSKILYVDNTSSNLWGGDTTLNETDDLTNGTTPPASYIWAGDNTDARFELWDATYKKDNVFMIHYEWINSSVVTDYSEYKVIIIADYNAAEINTILAQNSNVYGYISVADYADTTSWENSTKLKIDDWVDNYSVNIFIDGIDGVVSGTNFSTRFKVITDYARATKGVSTILNSYTVYNEFATYGDMIMKESAFSRWDDDVDNPTYSWEDMTIEKERADYYTSHNITVLGMSFGEVDDYSKMAFDTHAFAVLYGFDGRNSWKYGQPNFQAQREVYIPDWGNMLESTYTETSATDWNRLYEIGRVHINPVDHTYSIDNNINVNSMTFYIHLYSGAAGAGDRNVYLYVNNMTNNYTLPYDSPSTGVWYNKSVTINVEDYNTTGHYYVYGYTRPDSGGWNFLGEYDKTGSGIHTWYDTTVINLPDNYTGQTWNSIQLDRNFAVALNINYTTSEFLDEIEDKINQTLTDENTDYLVNLTSSNSYPDTLIWSGVVSHSKSNANSVTYFKAPNGTWVQGNSPNIVSDTSATVLDWSYTTIADEQYGVVRDANFNYRYIFPHMSSQEANTTIEYIPPVPTDIVNVSGYFNVNFSWTVGIGNVTDSYNVSTNNGSGVIWNNGSLNNYSNTTTGADGYVNISIWSYNSSGIGTLSLTLLTDNVTVTSVPTTPVITNVMNGSLSSTSQYVNWTVNQTTNNRAIYDTGSVYADSTANTTTWAVDHDAALAYDSNWSSYAESAGASTEYIYFNYTIPTNANQSVSLWHIKDEVGESNLTISSDCWASTLYLRAAFSDTANSVTWGCDNGSGWTNLHSAVANIAYEQEVLFKYTSDWDNSTSVPNITISGLTSNTTYNFVAWSYNVTDESYNSSSDEYSFTTSSTPGPNTSTIVVPTNSWGMFNNWTSATTFSAIAANESNDVSYSFYNVSSGKWESYYVGYSWNANAPIGADNSVMGFFYNESTITATIITPSSTELYTGWNMLFVENSDNETVADIKADIGANCTDVWWFNSTAGDYSNTTTDTVQANQGFLSYITQNMTWTRSDM